MNLRDINTKEPFWFAKLFSNEPTKFFVLILLVVVMLWFALALPIVWLAGYARASSGRIGDTFGIVNSLFSALGFAALTYTLIKQNETIKQQEHDTRVDRFESKLFQMLEAQREIVSEIDLKRTVRTKYANGAQSKKRVITTKGRECFRVMYRQHFINFVFSSYQEHHGHYSIDHERRKKRDAFELVNLNHLIYLYNEKLFPMFQNDLGHYYRHLYHIVDMVDKADYVVDKSEYIRIIRAQLSMHELLLLFYNGLSNHGTKFQVLIEKHALLKNLPEGYLINGSYDIYDSETHEALPRGYQLSAFGKRQYEPRKTIDDTLEDI